MKWGEYSNDIQFILRRSDSSNNQKPSQPINNSRSPIGNGFVFIFFSSLYNASTLAFNNVIERMVCNL